MKEGRSKTSPIVDPEELKKLCAARRVVPEVDPLKIFVDSPVYREPKVRDVDTYKEGELDATKPFGEVFQQGKQFEEDVYEPESPFGEKTFTQEHPLFGDFGVKTYKTRNLQESPECDHHDAQDDPEEHKESREYENPDALDDPEEEQQKAEAEAEEAGAGAEEAGSRGEAGSRAEEAGSRGEEGGGGAEEETPVEDVFDDKAFDEPPAEEAPQTFEKLYFEPTEEDAQTAGAEAAPEEAPEDAEATDADPEEEQTDDEAAAD